MYIHTYIHLYFYIRGNSSAGLFTHNIQLGYRPGAPTRRSLSFERLSVRVLRLVTDAKRRLEYESLMASVVSLLLSKTRVCIGHELLRQRRSTFGYRFEKTNTNKQKEIGHWNFVRVARPNSIH